ncbi:MAG: hypothetical protein ACRD44_16620, partial [Bryobacteraceae bacterium]
MRNPGSAAPAKWSTPPSSRPSPSSRPAPPTAGSPIAFIHLARTSRILHLCHRYETAAANMFHRAIRDLYN